MKRRNNKLFNLALGFSNQSLKPFPENVLVGFSKLVTLKETQLKVILDEDTTGEFEKATGWFPEKKISPELIKTGMPLVINKLFGDEFSAAAQKFEEFLDSECPESASATEILDKILELSTIKIAEVFGTDKDIASVMDYLSGMKSPEAEDKETAKADNKEAKEEPEKEKPEEKSEGKTSGGQEPESKKDKGPGDFPFESVAKKTEEADKNAETEKKPEEKEEPVDFATLAKTAKKLSVSLLDSVLGQEYAVSKFVNRYLQGQLLSGLGKDKVNRNLFFFFGPSGVGKTFLAKTAAESLGIQVMVKDLSQFDKMTLMKDSRSEEPNLLDFVQNNPKSVLVLKGIENSSAEGYEFVIKLLKEGKYERYGKGDVDFGKTIIVLTSGFGKEIYADRSINTCKIPEKMIKGAIESEQQALKEEAKQKNERYYPLIPEEVVQYISSENAIFFNYLTLTNIVDMIRDAFDGIVNDFSVTRNIAISYSGNLPYMFLYSYGGNLDARQIRQKCREFMVKELSELLRQYDGDDSKANISCINLSVDLNGVKDEIKDLFEVKEKPRIVVFSDELKGVSAAENDDCIIECISDMDKALEAVKTGASAICIDPYFGENNGGTDILSITDYSTDGIAFFHELIEKKVSVPIMIIESGNKFSEADKSIFIVEGAVGIIGFDPERPESFKREIAQSVKDIQMEEIRRRFVQVENMLYYNSKQTIEEGANRADIVFYDVKVKKVISFENRGKVLEDSEKPNIHFSDVIGAENAKEELKYFVDFLTNPTKFVLNGERAPRGVLLYGPPGTGKTMLAKAMAGESNVSFIQATATGFMSKWVGDSEKNVRDMFARARSMAPAIIFIDEIDAIGKQRTGHDPHSEKVLNELLTQMDGFASQDVRRPVFVLAATNYGAGEEASGIAQLDEALIRRFDNKIYVDLPKEEERKEYIQKMLPKLGMNNISDEAIKNIAERTPGKSLAIIQNILMLAKRNAQKLKRPAEDGDLLTAIEEYSFGEKREHSDDYYRSVSIHEIGHAYISYLHNDKPSYITIESRGNFGGYMLPSNGEKTPQRTREDLVGKIRTCLAGRAAEQVFYGKEKSLNSGASSDLQHATNVAFQIIGMLGMDDKLLVLTKEEILRSSLAKEYADKVNELLAEQMKVTVELIEKGKDIVDEAAKLLAVETRLTGAQFEEIMKKHNVVPIIGDKKA